MEVYYVVIGLFLLVVLVVAPLSYHAGARVPLEMYHDSLRDYAQMVQTKDKTILWLKNDVADAKEQVSELMTDKDLLIEFIESTYEFQFMAKVIECEAGGEPYASKVKIAHVILNRVAHPEFPNTISEVLTQDGQFVPVMEGIAYDTKASPDSKSAILQAIVNEDNTDGALFFLTPIGDNVVWFDVNRSLTLEEGNFRFYK